MTQKNLKQRMRADRVQEERQEQARQIAMRQHRERTTAEEERDRLAAALRRILVEDRADPFRGWDEYWDWVQAVCREALKEEAKAQAPKLHEQ